MNTHYQGTVMMRSRRPLAINNSLVHGICNYSCPLCGVNKPSYDGPRMYQSEKITRLLITRCLEAADQNVPIRYIANAGDGEPTLHPRFAEIMDLFGFMLQGWPSYKTEKPEVSVVTNGSQLCKGFVLNAIAKNGVTLIISLPTIDPGHYGMVMTGDASKGQTLLEPVLAGVDRALQLYGNGSLAFLNFHVSPPERDIVRQDFDALVEYVSQRAAVYGVKELTFILFPATANRSGLVESRYEDVDFFRDIHRRYTGRVIHGVRLNLSYSMKRFLKNYAEIIDVLRVFSYPCLWNAQLFVTAGGISICCNDQAVRHPLGSIEELSIAGLMEQKESLVPGKVCAACNQAPSRLRGGLITTLWGKLATFKLALVLRRMRKNVE